MLIVKFDPLRSTLVLVILAVGVKSSATFTNIFTILNLAVVSFFIVVGLTFGNHNYFTLVSIPYVLMFLMI